MAVFAVPLFVIGILRKAPTPELSAESLAMAGFGGVALVAVLVSPRMGWLWPVSH
ncbi:hypothetical protein [Nocardia sp. NPDC003963]